MAFRVRIQIPVPLFQLCDLGTFPQCSMVSSSAPWSKSCKEEWEVKKRFPQTLTLSEQPSWGGKQGLLFPRSNATHDLKCDGHWAGDTGLSSSYLKVWGRKIASSRTFWTLAHKKKKSREAGQACVECLPSMHKTLYSISRTEMKISMCGG